MKTIAITIGDDILERIDRVSENRSEFIRNAVGDFLMRMEQTAEEERERAILRRHRERLRREAIALIKDQAKP
jgi:metal-responsive CopG/Arc/MetJ family transcriptional regulator